MAYFFIKFQSQYYSIKYIYKVALWNRLFLTECLLGRE